MYFVQPFAWNRNAGRLLALLGILTLVPVLLSAQDRWHLLDVNLESGFESELLWPRPGAEVFWRNAQVGYYHTFDEANLGAGLLYFKTTDGGTTWTKQTTPDPVPHKLLTSQFGYSDNGYVTSDGGNSWRKLTARYNDTNFFRDPSLKYTISQSIAYDQTHIVALYQLHDRDPNSGDSVPYGPYRFAYSSDGANNWTYTDSITVYPGVTEELYDSTSFGKFPRPAGVVNINRNSSGWSKLLSYPNDSIVNVLIKIYGDSGNSGLPRNYYYIGRYNLKAKTAVYAQLPFSTPLFPPPADDLRVEFLDDNTIIVIQAEFVDIFNNPDDVKRTLWRSDNRGGNWQKYDLPSSIDFRSLRFVNTNNAVASNAVSNDGGKTWSTWHNLFGPGSAFYAVDSADYRFFGRFSLYAKSSDAGHTWTHNEAGGIPIAAAAYDGRVFVGRNYQSMMISLDSGATWSDPGADGRLPARLSQVIAVGFPDPTADPDRMIAVGSFLSYEGVVSYAILESSDAGNVWSVGQQLPELAGFTGAVRLQFASDPDVEVGAPYGFIASSKGLIVSEDAGLSWSQKNSTLQFEDIHMITQIFGSAVTADGIYVTENSGTTWTKKDSRAGNQKVVLGGDHFRDGNAAYMFADTASNYRNWSAEEAEPGLQTWTSTEGTGADRPMNIGAFWGDSNNIHVVGRYGTIQHSDDAGTSFSLEVDSVQQFLGFAGYVAGANDVNNLYVIGTGNTAGRFLMYWVPPSSVPVRGVVDVSATLLNNPVINDVITIQISTPRTQHASIMVVDLMGRTLSGTSQDVTVESGRTSLQIPAEEIASGRYSVVIQTADGMAVLPIVVLH